MALTDKITISTTVYDETGYPIPDANVYIDGIFAAMTSNDGTVTIANVANSLSTIKITHVAMLPYSVSAVFLPKKVLLKYEVNMLNEITITPTKKPTAPAAPATPASEPKLINWLLLFSLFGIGYKLYQRHEANTIVKAKI